MPSRVGTSTPNSGYISAVDPVGPADIVVDNSWFGEPRIVPSRR
jgi:hypothetical protein